MRLELEVDVSLSAQEKQVVRKLSLTGSHQDQQQALRDFAQHLIGRVGRLDVQGVGVADD